MISPSLFKSTSMTTQNCFNMKESEGIEGFRKNSTRLQSHQLKVNLAQSLRATKVTAAGARSSIHPRKLKREFLAEKYVVSKRESN
jgi:hypothetical protein